CTRVSHVNGSWVVNPTHEQEEEATIELVVAGRQGPSGDVDIMMIEAGGSDRIFELIDAGAQRPDEELLADGIEFSKQYIAEAIALQKELVDAAGKPKGTAGGP